MSNPLRAMSADNSQKYSLSTLDLQKTFRMLLVALIPMLLNLAPNIQTYLGSNMLIWHGVNWSPAALALLVSGIELGRRFVAGPVAPTPTHTLTPTPASSMEFLAQSSNLSPRPGSVILVGIGEDKPISGVPSLEAQLHSAGLMVDATGRLVPSPRG